MTKWIGYEFCHAYIDRDWCVMRRGGHTADHTEMDQVGWRVWCVLPDGDHADARQLAADAQAGHNKRESKP